jgi:hypothetical protein
MIGFIQIMDKSTDATMDYTTSVGCTRKCPPEIEGTPNACKVCKNWMVVFLDYGEKDND